MCDTEAHLERLAAALRMEARKRINRKRSAINFVGTVADLESAEELMQRAGEVLGEAGATLVDAKIVPYEESGARDVHVVWG